MRKLLFAACVILTTRGAFIRPAEKSPMPTIQHKNVTPKNTGLINSMRAALNRFFTSKKTIPKQPLSLSLENITPVIFYEPATTSGGTSNRIILITTTDSDTIIDKNKGNYFDDVNSYTLTPQKKYLLVEEIRTESLGARFLGMVGEKMSTTKITKLINAKTKEEITSFSGAIIMHEFSRDETTLLIAGPKKTLQDKLIPHPDTKGAARTGKRIPKSSGEILRYELFDIASKKVLKTFENIQSITYTSNNQLFVKYDNGAMETITINTNPQLSLFQKIIHMFTKQPTITAESTPTTNDPIKIRTEYDDKQETFTLQINENAEIQYPHAISYDFSPHKKYILIKIPSNATIGVLDKAKAITGQSSQKRTITKLLNLNSGKEIALLEDVITYEFIRNSDENRVLILCTTPSTFLGMQYGSSEYCYYLYDTAKQNGPIKQFDATTKSAYFKSPRELIVIDKDGNQIACDPQTGQSFIDRENEKNAQLKKEEQEQLQKQEKEKQEKLRQQQQQLEQAEKKQQELLKKAEKTQAETNIQEQGWLKAQQPTIENEPTPETTAPKIFPEEEAEFARQDPQEAQEEINRQEQNWLTAQQPIIEKESATDTTALKIFPGEEEEFMQKEAEEKQAPGEQTKSAVTGVDWLKSLIWSPSESDDQ